MERGRLQANIISIQETHFQASTMSKCSHRDFPHLFLALAPEKKRGVLLAIKNSVSFHLKDYLLDQEGQYIILTCDIKPYTLVAVCVPNSHQI